MLIAATIPYTARSLRSNRHRRLESLPFTADAAVELAEVAVADAPLIVEIGEVEDRHTESKTVTWQPYRRYLDRVWVRASLRLEGAHDALVHEAGRAPKYDDHQPQAERRVLAAAAAWCRDRRIIDGAIWVPTHEPQLNLKLFGDHAWIEITTGLYNLDQVYRLDEMDAIRARCARIHDLDESGYRVRHLRADLLHLPPHAIRTATREWHELAEAVCGLARETWRVDRCLADVERVIAGGAQPVGMPPELPVQLRAVLASLAGIAGDPALKARAAADPREDHRPAPLPGDDTTEPAAA